MLKTLPSKEKATTKKSNSFPKNETLNAILNFSRSTEVKEIENKKVIFNYN